MFFDILKRDLKRKKTMNVIVLLFVILSVMFISSSVTNLTAVTGSLDSFFDKAGVGDYMTFERSGRREESRGCEADSTGEVHLSDRPQIHRT